MSKIVKKVKKKLNDYGIRIHNIYQIDDEGEHVFYVDDMILFVNTEEESIGLALQATTKPDKAATLALILNETGYTIHIMEPFIFSDEKEFISGKKAYEFIDESKQDRIINQMAKQQYYLRILESEDCFEC